MTRICVTGANGLAGKAVVQELRGIPFVALRRGGPVTRFSRPPGR